MQELATVTTSDLSRKPGEVLSRVRRGERLVVVRHKDPIATLQPLDGFVSQPFGGAAHDVFGWPIGGLDEEIEKLTDCGLELTGRGLAMHEALRREVA